MIDENMITQVKKRLVEIYDPLEIYIFGSYAWGHPDEESDLDLLVVVESYIKDKHHTLVEGHKALMDLDLFKDLVVYNKQDFQKCSADVTSLCYKVANKGKKIYAGA